MPIPDCVLTPARERAILNRGKMTTYREFVSETTNLKTGSTVPVFRDKPVRALVSGMERVEDGVQRTFRFLSAQLPEFPPSMRSVVLYDGRTYRVVGWKTSQHEDVVDVMGASP